MSEILHGLPVECSCLVEWGGFAEWYVIIGVPTPKDIAVWVKLYNLVEKNRVVSDLPDVVLQSEKSVVDWIILNIMFTNNIWESLQSYLRLSSRYA